MARRTITNSNIQIKTFTYMGDGSSIRKVNIGFSPDIVFIKGNTTQYGVFKTPITWANWTPLIVPAAIHLKTGGILEFLQKGITIGNGDTVNSSGIAYHGFAIKGNSKTVAYGNYAGNGVQGREIPCGFKPAFVMIKRDNVYVARYRDKLDAVGTCHYATNAAADKTDSSEIIDFTDDGFTVGTSQGVNNATGALGYSWFAIADIPEMSIFSYTGNGADNRNITGLGLNPIWAMVKTSGQHIKYIQDTMPADYCGDFNNGAPFLTDRIQALITDGIQVGTQLVANGNGLLFHGVAFKSSNPRTEIPKKDYGTCLKFDGVDDIVSVSGANLNNLNQITVCGFIKPTSLGENSRGVIFSKGDNLASRLLFKIVGTNQISLTSKRDTTSGSWVSLNEFLKLGVWQFVAFTYDLSNVANVPVLYLNGNKMEITSTQPVGTIVADDANTYFGNESTTESTFNGLLDNMKVFNRILTADELKQEYEGFDIENPQLYLKFDEASGVSAIDSSMNGYNGTITGAAYSTDVYRKSRSISTNRFLVREFTKSGFFDGIDDGVNAGNNNSLNLLNALTIEAWIYPISYGGGSKGRIVDRSSGASNGYIFYLENSAIVKGIRITLNDVNFSSSPNIIELNKWQHIMVTFDKNLASNQIKFYVNGVVCGVATKSTAITTDNSILRVGYGRLASRLFNGYMDNLKIYSRGLTAAENQNRYYRDRNIINGLVSFWNFNDNMLDQVGVNNGTVSGMAYSDFVPMKNRISI